MDFPDGSDGKESACNAADLGQEDPLEKEMALQYSFPENSKDRGAWQATGNGAARAGHDWLLVTACGIKFPSQGWILAPCIGSRES